METIKQIKEFYGVGREALHHISGISTDALKRYESGDEVPRKYQMLLRLMLNIDTFEKLFHLSKQNLPQGVINTIETKLESEKRWRISHVKEFENKVMNVSYKPSDK